jgi:hypothetical protein
MGRPARLPHRFEQSKNDRSRRPAAGTSSPHSIQPALPRYTRAITPPKWIAPQLCKLATHAPSGPLWVHEIKFDGYRIAARITPGKAQLLTRSGLDWTAKYPTIAVALTKLPVQSAYLDGELCAVRPNGVSDFGLMQQSAPASSITSSISSSSTASKSPPCRSPSARAALRLCSPRRPPASTSAPTRPATVKHSAAPHAATASKASSPSASTSAICPAIAAPGSRRNASTAANSSSWAGPSPKARDPISAPYCSPITTTTAVFSTPAGLEPACRRRRSPCCTRVSRRSLSSHSARRPAAARDALRRSPRAVARALGSTRSRCRDHLSHQG